LCRKHVMPEALQVKPTTIAMTLLLTLVAWTTPSADAEQRQRVPFTQSLSNTRPLLFGMTAQDAAIALGVPLDYVSGPPGNEVLAAVRPSSGYFNREARLFLQFRAGRLSGWKGDWGRNWMWE
jgi:hypothetical protein